MTDLDEDFTLLEAAQAIRMSERWLRGEIKKGEKGEGPFIAHTRRGHKITFTAEQIESLRRTHAVEPVEASITTGRKKARA